jgi:hypothetical protein
MNFNLVLFLKLSNILDYYNYIINIIIYIYRLYIIVYKIMYIYIYIYIVQFNGQMSCMVQENCYSCRSNINLVSKTFDY